MFTPPPRKATSMLLLAGLLVFSISCMRTSAQSDSKYLRMVGDSEFDPKQDDPAFKVCDEANAKQYHNFEQGFQYKGEKYELKRFFNQRYSAKKMAGETGLIRIRFLVNCKGETGRFRLIGMDENYASKTFNAAITNQLLQLTKSLTGWKLMPNDDTPEDYYQYLIFKIQDGQLIEMLP